MELTKKEQELMEVLWKAGRPLSSKEIVENSIDKTWKDSSIHILLNSLLDKGALKEAGYVRTGKGYGRTFEPTESGEKYYAEFLATIAKRTTPKLFMSALFNSEELNDEMLEELEAILNERKKRLKQ